MTSTTTLRQEKDAYIVQMIDNGINTGSHLEAGLKKKFPGKVSARFRSEVAGLISRSEIVREGVGSSATFSLPIKGEKGTEKPVGTKAVIQKPIPQSPAAAKPDPVPEVQLEKLTPAELCDIAAALKYLARNGARPIEIVLKKAFPNGWSMNEIVSLVMGVKRDLMTQTDEGLIITREGYRCLDTVLAGKKYE